MRKLIILLFICLLLCSACSTLHTVELEPNQLRQQIRQGEIISKGNGVKVFTHNGQSQYFRVKEITYEKLVGNSNKEVNIDDIVAVKVNKYDARKTAFGFGLFGVFVLLAYDASGNL